MAFWAILTVGVGAVMGARVAMGNKQLAIFSTRRWSVGKL